MQEFNFDGMPDLYLRSNEPAAIQRLLGRQVVSAEAFTGLDRWHKGPAWLKGVGDIAFTHGVNRFQFHGSGHQPWTGERNRWPGVTHLGFGLHFQRNNTWFEPGRAWITYLSRCQSLLQQGIYPASILKVDVEDAPGRFSLSESVPPAGYQLNLCDAEMLATAEVNNGRVVFPSGASHRLLVLPRVFSAATPGFMRTIRRLVEAGAVVMAPDKPRTAPGLEGYPESVNALNEIVGALWGAGTSGKHQVGNGTFYWGRDWPIEKVLSDLGIEPDVTFAGESLPWIHRTIDDVEVYFFAHRSDKPGTFEVSFDVEGRTPELWHADTGAMEEARVWQAEAGGRTRVTLDLDPNGSVFVVFRKPAKTKGRALEAPRVVRTLPLDKPWQLRFPDQTCYGDNTPAGRTLGSLISWSEFEDEDGKYFSGTAVYSTSFRTPLSGARAFLDLGTVKETAEVILNGRNLGVLWKPPYRVEITDALQEGENRLELRVTNLWANRLIGDRAKGENWQCGGPGKNQDSPAFDVWPDWVLNGDPLPANGRKTFVITKFYRTGKEPLLPSGLLGPVTVEYLNQ
jgi:hypothetical protein